jgi:ribosome-binding factor A
MSLRTERVAEAIREELMDILLKDLKDPRVGFTSVTHVDVSQDLKHARIYLSVLGDETAQEDCLAALTKAKGRIKNELTKRIRLRCVPELVFDIDKSVEHSLRISEILKDIEAEEEDEPDN